ncbi:MAG: type II toxin-antitoxin system VapC family toxin [Dehalococcoidia bacterium]|nr:type II toxin-antitoxin system VapC family toxin [Dehalococcoidia bacterium]
MILVDTSVWIDHLRESEHELTQMLNANDVLTHPIVIGELACGNLPNREQFLREVELLPAVASWTHDEVRGFIESERLMGRGIGFMDAHLIYSVMNRPGDVLWTRDRRLSRVAQELSVSHFEARVL